MKSAQAQDLKNVSYAVQGSANAELVKGLLMLQHCA